MKALTVGGHRTEAEALESAGYSPLYAKSGNVKRTESWQALAARVLNDDLLTRKHLEGLEATRTIAAGEQVIERPDFPTRGRYLELAYKVRGRLADPADGAGSILLALPARKGVRTRVAIEQTSEHHDD